MNCILFCKSTILSEVFAQISGCASCYFCCGTFYPWATMFAEVVAISSILIVKKKSQTSWESN